MGGRSSGSVAPWLMQRGSKRVGPLGSGGRGKAGGKQRVKQPYAAKVCHAPPQATNKSTTATRRVIMNRETNAQLKTDSAAVPHAWRTASRQGQWNCRVSIAQRGVKPACREAGMRQHWPHRLGAYAAAPSSVRASPRTCLSRRRHTSAPAPRPAHVMRGSCTYAKATEVPRQGLAWPGAPGPLPGSVPHCGPSPTLSAPTDVKSSVRLKPLKARSAR